MTRIIPILMLITSALFIFPIIGYSLPDNRDGEYDTFKVEEGRNINLFYQKDDLSCHIVLTNEFKPKVVVAFPQGNSGAAIFFDENWVENNGLKMEPIGFPEKVLLENGMIGVKFKIRLNKGKSLIKSLYLESIRYLRDLDYPEESKKRIEKVRLFSQKAKIPEQGRVFPEVKILRNRIDASRITLTGKNHYRLILESSDSDFASQNGGRILLKAQNGDQTTLQIIACCDYENLKPYSVNEILNDGVNEFIERMRKANTPTAERLAEAFRALKFLSYQDKMLAGSWRFLTYFGRDTLLTTLLMKDCFKPQIIQNAIRAVLDRISDTGDVAHEEDIGCQAIYRNIDSWLEIDGKIETEAAFARKPQRISSALKKFSPPSACLSELDKPVYDYKMVDDDFLLPIAVREYLDEKGFRKSEKQKFLFSKNLRGESNLISILRNVEFCLESAIPFASNCEYSKLIKIRHPFVGDWRDSNMGLGYGKYSGNVNVDLVLASLKSIKRILSGEIFSKKQIVWLSGTYNFKEVLKCSQNAEILDNFIEKWGKSAEIYKVNLSVDELRESLKKLFEGNYFGKPEKDYFLSELLSNGTNLSNFLFQGRVPQDLSKGLTFYALSLMENGSPVKVINSDFGFRLFLGDPSEEEIRSFLNLIKIPFPLGLKTSAGILVSNPLFSGSDELINQMNRNGYHGTVIWSWQQAMIQKGLMKQIKRFIVKPGNEKLVKEMFGVLEEIENSEKNCGKLINSELWTYEVIPGTISEMKKKVTQKAQVETEEKLNENWDRKPQYVLDKTFDNKEKATQSDGSFLKSKFVDCLGKPVKLVPTPFGAKAEAQTEANPVQLWSTVSISVLKEREEIKKLMEGLK
ncbi:MAG: hypothetical protein HQM08_15030 [Candidatus Riflebacteria bacterium]|nr:hypothetical protein [Candidatus Riflebacteria bacterium]